LVNSSISCSRSARLSSLRIPMAVLLPERRFPNYRPLASARTPTEGSMIKRLTTILAALLLLAFAVAGCGDDESGSAGGSDTAAETATTGDATTGTTEPGKPARDEDEADKDATGDGSTTAGGTTPPAVSGDQVERCKDTIGQAKQLSDDAKSKIGDLCEKAASDDADDRQEAGRDLCRVLVEESIPEDSPQRESALKSCESAAGQIK
jgi:hypothetical protein